MRLLGGIVARIGNQGALRNARTEIEANRITRARVEALARRLGEPDADRRRRGTRPDRRRSGVA